MPRNNYYTGGSIPDDQPAPSYASNVPDFPNTGGERDYGGPTQIPSDIVSQQYTGSEDDNGCYEPTTPIRYQTEVDTSKDSINSVILVVGWLVCTKGENIGKDYRLHVGWNYIGRGDLLHDDRLDIDLNDQKVSRNMAKISYDPISRTFGVAPSEGAKSLCYLNGKPLRGDRDFEAYDRLMVGDTELMLIPLCGEKFAWEFDKV
ncbi:MAG: hypothetical protein ACI3V0_09440 [Faecousia sp.]